MTEIITDWKKINSFEEGLQKYVPQHMHGGVRRYFEHHIEPGSFLTALLSGKSVIDVVACADDINAENLHNWAKFLYNHVPSVTYGSTEKVKAWLENRDV